MVGKIASYTEKSNGSPAERSLAPPPLALAAALDLRRSQPKPVVDAILLLARHAPARERGVIVAIFEEGRTLTDIASASGENPREARRRYRRAISRILEPRFAFVAGARDTWPDRRRLVATLHFLSGRTIRDIARRLGLTEHAVRRELGVVDALYDEFIRTTHDQSP